MYRTINPSTGELVREYGLSSDDQIEGALRGAEDGFLAWRSFSFSQRAALMLRLADLVDERTPELAKLMATEMGKLRVEGEQEVARCSGVCRFFAAAAERLLAPEPREGAAEGQAHIRFDPLGPVLIIMPWNFPLWQVFRCAVPALMAGNVILLKHAPNVPGCAETISDLFRDAGFPQPVFQNLFLTNEQSARVIADRRVVGVSLTGSVRAGQEVAALCGRHMKKCVLELGGSDAFIIFADADIPRAVDTGVAFRCLNSGQSCISPKRFLVEAPIFDTVLSAMTSAFAVRRIGDPFEATTEMGPLARADLRDNLLRQLQECIRRGAVLHCGGTTPSRPGFFFTPAVISNIEQSSPARTEELFGPVAVLIPFQNEGECIRIANETTYGLGAAVWTSDSGRAARLARELEAGCVVINGAVRSEPFLPFGGIKDSGLGRELGEEGIREFTNVKTVRSY